MFATAVAQQAALDKSVQRGSGLTVVLRSLGRRVAFALTDNNLAALNRSAKHITPQPMHSHPPFALGTPSRLPRHTSQPQGCIRCLRKDGHGHAFPLCRQVLYKNLHLAFPPAASPHRQAVVCVGVDGAGEVLNGRVGVDLLHGPGGAAVALLLRRPQPCKGGRQGLDATPIWRKGMSRRHTGSTWSVEAGGAWTDNIGVERPGLAWRGQAPYTVAAAARLGQLALSPSSALAAIPLAVRALTTSSPRPHLLQLRAVVAPRGWVRQGGRVGAVHDQVQPGDRRAWAEYISQGKPNEGGGFLTRLTTPALTWRPAPASPPRACGRPYSTVRGAGRTQLFRAFALANSAWHLADLPQKSRSRPRPALRHQHVSVQNQAVQ